MSLQIKYRPKSFDEVFGNRQVVEALKKIVARKNRPHAFLFHGPPGTGKTTLAGILAGELGASGRDFIEMDSATYRGIKDIRELKDIFFIAPSSKARFVFFDEAHKLTKDAEEAMLKDLERFPPHLYFAFATTEPKQLLPTTLSRLTPFETKKLSTVEMRALIQYVVGKEGSQLPSVVIDKLVAVANGIPRDALKILDMVLSAGTKEAMLSVISNLKFDENEVRDLCRLLLSINGDGMKSWIKVRTVLEGLSDKNPEDIRRAVLGWCNVALMKTKDVRVAIRAFDIMACFEEPTYHIGFPGITKAAFRYCMSQNQE